MIQVIDSIMGSGKSTWMINYINDHPDQQYLIVVPYLSEVSRYETTLENIKGFQPKNRPGGKISDFKELVASGRNIVTTHALIKNIDRECLDLLKVQNYNLILDESMQVIEEYPIPQSDLKIILDNEYIKISENGFVVWNNENEDAKEYKGKWLKEIKKYAEMESLMAYQDNSKKPVKLIWNYPSKFFDYFNSIYIITYLWSGDIQEAYFKLHNISYEHLTLINGELKPYSSTHDVIERQKYKNLITILDDKKLNQIGEREYKEKIPLTSSWYKSNAQSLYMKVLKNHLYNFFRNKAKTPMKDNMWVTFKDYQGKLKGKGYTGSKKNPCFVPFNTRGTNEYANKKSLAFMVNVYISPIIKNFFSQHNIYLEQDKYATSVLVQWIWRSQIREDKPIVLYLPSERMKDLLDTFWG